MDSLDKIKENYALLTHRLETTEEYRNIWNSTLKNNIKSQLQAVVDHVCKGWVVHENTQKTNLESVTLEIPARPSGVTERYINGGKIFLRRSSYLMFSQTVNGRIVVIIVYPYVEDLTSRKPHDTIGFYDPDRIDNEFIQEQVNDFILAMLDWEMNKDPEPEKRQEPEKPEPIGFKFKGLNDDIVEV